MRTRLAFCQVELCGLRDQSFHNTIQLSNTWCVEIWFVPLLRSLRILENWDTQQRIDWGGQIRVCCHWLAHPLADPGGPGGRALLLPWFFFKIMQFSGNVEQILGSGPPWGQNSAGPPWQKSWIRQWTSEGFSSSIFRPRDWKQCALLWLPLLSLHLFYRTGLHVVFNKPHGLDTDVLVLKFWVKTPMENKVRWWKIYVLCCGFANQRAFHFSFLDARLCWNYAVF